MYKDIVDIVETGDEVVMVDITIMLTLLTNLLTLLTVLIMLTLLTLWKQSEKRQGFNWSIFLEDIYWTNSQAQVN